MSHDANLVVEITGEKVAELARLLRSSPYAATCFDRRLLGIMFEHGVWVSSPEDVILGKLLWYRAASVLDRQFQDVLEVYEIQKPYLEHNYLERWAHTLGSADLLERVRREADHPPNAKPPCQRLLKLARTITGLAGTERIQPAHIVEAIHLRPAAAGGVSCALARKLAA